MRANTFQRLGLLVSTTLVLSACGKVEESYQEYLQDKVDQGTTIAETSQSAPELTRPDSWDHLKTGISQAKDLQLGQTLFYDETGYSQTQTAYQVSVHQFEVLSLEGDKADQDQAGLLIAQVQISNTSDKDLYFPVDQVTLSYGQADSPIGPDRDLYPFQEGDLIDSFSEMDQRLMPGQSQEGYLIFSLTSADMDRLNDAPAVFLSFLPPVDRPDTVYGLEDAAYGQDLPLYLPLNQTSAEALQLKEGLIQDRITAEWWGTKEVLAQEEMALTQDQEGISVRLVRAELADFVPFEEYEESFQYFPNGQVILTIEFEITNQSQWDVLPVDSQIGALIGEDYIGSDYALINEVYGMTLGPGESIRTIRSFALDRQTYLDRWQGQPINLDVNINRTEATQDPDQTSTNQDGSGPTSQASDSSQSTSQGQEQSQVMAWPATQNQESSSQANLTGETSSEAGTSSSDQDYQDLPALIFTFTWEPKDLVLIDQSLPTTSSDWEIESTTSRQTQQEEGD